MVSIIVDKLEKLTQELERIYKCKFKIIKRDGFIEILHNDMRIKNREEICSKILKNAEKYLSEDEMFDVAIVYDYCNEIK